MRCGAEELGQRLPRVRHRQHFVRVSDVRTRRPWPGTRAASAASPRPLGSPRGVEADVSLTNNPLWCPAALFHSSSGFIEQVDKTQSDDT